MEEIKFKDRLKSLVGDQSFRAFAKKCGISDSVIRAYLRGDSDPTLGKIEKIASTCNVSMGWLAAGEGEQKSAPFEAGNHETMETLKTYPKVTEANVHLRQIIEWMAAEFGQKDEQALFFYEDLKDRYPTFAEFMEKKRPSGSGVAAQTQNENKKTA